MESSSGNHGCYEYKMKIVLNSGKNICIYFWKICSSNVLSVIGRYTEMFFFFLYFKEKKVIAEQRFIIVLAASSFVVLCKILLFFVVPIHNRIHTTHCYFYLRNVYVLLYYPDRVAHLYHGYSHEFRMVYHCYCLHLENFHRQCC